MRRHVIVLPQGPDEDVEEVVEEEEEQEDPEMAQALRDACFEAARIAANDSSERPTKTAFAIFKETSMKAAVAKTMDGHALNDDPARLVPGTRLLSTRSRERVGNAIRRELGR